MIIYTQIFLMTTRNLFWKTFFMLISFWSSKEFSQNDKNDVSQQRENFHKQFIIPFIWEHSRKFLISPKQLNVQ